MRLLPVLLFLATALFHKTCSTAIKRTQGRCEGSVVTETFSIGDAVVTQFACPHGVKSRSLIPGEASRAPHDVELQIRQEGYCDPSLEALGVPCVNGEPCNYIGADHDDRVIKADCDHLTAVLANVPGTFMVALEHATSIAYQSCEFYWWNTANTAVQAAYANWVSRGSVPPLPTLYAHLYVSGYCRIQCIHQHL
ncbi:hypothetical protein C8R45DRAFT_292914 [Mycena sanguinolenta]|nr:hypothetical protein C8R45DRAFT_292914 [Mycena sanguinolenta]